MQEDCKSPTTLQKLIEERNGIERKIQHVLSGRRPCGCSLRGRHSATCEDKESDHLNPWDGYQMLCCGSRRQHAHRNDCPLLAHEGTLPDEVEESSGAWFWDGKYMSCCNSTKKEQHKRGCRFGWDGKLPPEPGKDCVLWKCIRCTYEVELQLGFEPQQQKCKLCGDRMITK